MKNILSSLLLFLSITVYSQSDYTIIYIDKSSTQSESSFKDLKKKVKEIIAINSNAEVLLYISDGENPIINDRSTFKTGLSNLNKWQIARPDYEEELTRLRLLILDRNIISDIVSITKKSGINQKINFHFFIHDDNKETFNKECLNTLLHCNRLTYIEQYQDNCTVNTYTDNDNQFIKNKEQ